MAKTAAKNSRKSTVAHDAQPVTVHHAEALAMDDGGIDSLLAELTGEGEILNSDAIGATHGEPQINLSADEVGDVVGRLEAIDASVAAAMPTGDESAAVPSGDDSDAPAAEAATTAPAKVTRKHYTDKVERIKDRLGAGAADYTVLTLADADVSEEQLKQVMEDTFELIRGMNKKEQARAGLLFDFLTGKKATLNNVLETTLRVLNRDGHVTTGKTSNLITELLGKPYSIGSARAMSGNTVGMYHDLKLLKADGKGRFVGNPQSTLLAAANAKLGLGAAAA